MLNVKVGRAILVITLHGRRSEKCPPQLAGVGKSVAADGGKKTNLTKGGKQTPIFSSSSLTFRPPSLQISEVFCFCVCDLSVVPFWGQMSS